jgi:hypothetical protein
MKANCNFNMGWNSSRYPMVKRLGGLQSLSGHYGEEKISPWPGLELLPSSP